MARRAAIATILILLLVACTMPPTTSPTLPGQQQPFAGDPAAQATAQYRAAEDAAATYQTFSAEATAASDSATRNVLSVTEAAQAVASATAGAATGTAESQAVRMTEASMAVAATGTALFQSIEATRQSVAVQATGTAEARKAFNDAVLAADEARRQAQVRQEQQLRLEARQTWNQVWPFLTGVGVVVFVALAAVFGMSILKRMNIAPIQIITANGREYPLIQSSGQWQVVSQSGLPAREDQLMLPEGARDMQPQPLPALPDGHVLVVAETDGGKSTAMRSIIKHRKNVVVLDPHYMPGAWGDVRVIGGGLDYDSILSFMHHLYQEMTDRFQDRNSGRNQFAMMTVVTDEMPAIMGSEVGREFGVIWKQLIRQSRKVNLFVVFATQSTRVKSLGIEGEKDVLDNFKHILELGKVAASNYPELVEGMQRPAIIRSAHYDPQPVVIPYDPREDPDSPQFAGGQIDTSHQPLFVAPSVPRAAGMQSEWGHISAQQIQTILQMHNERKPNGECVHSHRAIERAACGYDGGNAYYIVEAVLQKYANATAMGA